MALFGWMDLLIILKWLRTCNIESFDPAMIETCHNSPAIITSMIDMFLSPGS